jgi:hypothetical protein
MLDGASNAALPVVLELEPSRYRRRPTPVEGGEKTQLDRSDFKDLAAPSSRCDRGRGRVGADLVVPLVYTTGVVPQ